MSEFAPRLVFSLLCTVLPAQAPAAPAGEAAFDQGCAAVRAHMQKGRWNEAKAALEELVRGHGEQGYVKARREAILQDHSQCAFLAAVRVPPPQELIRGELLQYTPATGKVKLRYTPDRLADFPGEGAYRIHPLVFAGPYTITVSGSYPTGGDTLQVLCEVQPDSFLIADFGYAADKRHSHATYVPASLWLGEGERKPVTVESRESPAIMGARYQALVRVTNTQVEMHLDKKKVITRKREGPFGGFGIDRNAFTELVVEGTIEPAWLQGAADDHLAKAREDFMVRYRPAADLPDWLLRLPDGTPTAPRHQDEIPGVRGGDRDDLAPILQSLGEQNFTGALRAIDQLAADTLQPVTLHFLRGLLRQRLGDPQGAVAALEQALALQPDFTGTRCLLADAFWDLRQQQRSLELLQQALADDPGELAVYERLVPLLLRRGEIDAAERVVRHGKAQHNLWNELRGLDTTLTMARRGPSWPRRITYQAAHYEIHSDIDRKICYQASVVLEEIYRNLKAQLGGVKDDASTPRFQVFLFSGEAGYQDYCKAILGDAVPHTAGLYSPVLKQLLIWNVPTREQMERTIRHEGFHQYLDRVMTDPPVWFNEGMAEYYENGQRVRGQFDGGQVNDSHLKVLAQRPRLLSLHEFVYGNRGDFYRSAGYRYPQAWAVVHFLRRSSGPNQKRFQALWDALRAGMPTRDALDKAFQGVDWAELDREFWTYVQGLRQK